MSSEQAGKKSLPVLEEQAQQRLPPSLLTKDICDFLRDLARILENPVTGNPPLAATLTKLAKALGRYSSQDVNKVLSGLTFRASRREARKHGPSSQLQGVDLASLDLKMVEEILRNRVLTKGDLVRLGSERFGISRSKLDHQNREDAIDEIEAALRNVEALDIISQEARREGNRRTS
jgi:hypothetical protein